MTNGSADSPERDFGFYVVGLFDILGQGKALEGLKKLPGTEEERNQYATHLQKTIRTVNSVRSLLGQFVDIFNQGRTNPKRHEGLLEEQRPIYDSLMNVEMKHWVFSDTIIMFAPIMVPMDKFSITPLLALLHAAAGTMIDKLSEGIVIRGGIDIGIGGQFWKGELYGPALAQAYHLESRVASWPRILVGDGVREYLDAWKADTSTQMLAVINQGLARKCRSYLSQDEDGQWILDYLGKDVQVRLSTNPPHAETLSKAFEFVKHEHQRFQTQGKQDLAFKFSQLKRYFESRIIPS